MKTVSSSVYNHRDHRHLAVAVFVCLLLGDSTSLQLNKLKFSVRRQRSLAKPLSLELNKSPTTSKSSILFRRRPVSSLSKRFFRRLEDHESWPKDPPSPFAILDDTIPAHKGNSDYVVNDDNLNGSTVTSKKYSMLIPNNKKIQVSNVQELRRAVLDSKTELRHVQLTPTFADVAAHDMLNHHVLQLIAQRFHSGSTPGNRQDNATLALAIEGGGMRGCVSAGMAAAIACLGLCDTFDTIYGSSAGSVTGAYIVSRQVCLDVFVDILTAAKKKFVCTERMVRSLASSLVDLMFNARLRAKRKKNENGNGSVKTRVAPGMNISFVLDGIMGQDHGIRPLDMEVFQANNARQPLRVASSSVVNGKLFSRCFGTNDYFNSTTSQAVRRADGTRSGLFTCLEASMTVPGATGPPVDIIFPDNDQVAIPCFDAFCFEPLPYRSAVQEGATHVLVLCSRPEGFEPKTKPGVYEQGIAPLYFHSHGQPAVAKFFEKGGQLYLYAEDLLTLEEGKLDKSNEGILVPPPIILYGSTPDDESELLARKREELWKRAHLLPVKVSRETPELPTLEQDKDAVLAAVRSGFTAAFDLLVPAMGLKLDIDGVQAAKLVFPDDGEDDDGVVTPTSAEILGTKIHVAGEHIADGETVPAAEPKPYSLGLSPIKTSTPATFVTRETDPQVGVYHAETLLNCLPGLKEGRLHHLGKGLRAAKRLPVN
jgi:hypothetical protein